MGTTMKSPVSEWVNVGVRVREEAQRKSSLLSNACPFHSPPRSICGRIATSVRSPILFPPIACCDDLDYLIIFGSTIGGMMGMLCILLLYRHCLKRREYAYTRVYHGLDPEEEEFKRALESQTDEIDDLFDFSPDGEEGNLEDMEFDDKDLKQLEMLETYRRNLEGGLESEGTGREDEDVLDASV